MFAGKAGAFRAKHVLGNPLYGILLAFLTNIRQLERLAREEHLSFIRTFVNYGM
jgi:hypothetical protein